MIGQDLWERQEDETYRVNIVGQEMFSDQLKVMDDAQRKVMSQDSQGGGHGGASSSSAGGAAAVHEGQGGASSSSAEQPMDMEDTKRLEGPLSPRSWK